MKIKQILTEATVSRHDLDRLKRGMAQMLDKLEKAIDFKDTSNQSMADHHISSMINSILSEKDFILRHARSQEDIDAAIEAEQRAAQEAREYEEKRLQGLEQAKNKLLATKGSPDWIKFKKFVLSDKLKLPADPNNLKKGNPRRIIEVTPKNIDVLRPNATIERTPIAELTTPESLDQFARKTTEEVTADYAKYSNYINSLKYMSDEGISYRWRDIGAGFKLQIDDKDFNKVYNIAVYETGGGSIEFNKPGTVDFIRSYSTPTMELSLDQMSEIKHIGEMYNYLAEREIVDNYRSIKDVRPVGTGSILFNIYGIATDINSADIHSAGDMAKEIYTQSSKPEAYNTYN